MSAVSVVASGMVTSIGNSAPATAAALRAGIRGVTEGNIWDWTGGQNLGVARPVMHQWWEGRDMLAELVAPAIEECTAAAVRMCGLEPDAVPVVLLVAPPHRPCRWPELDSQIGRDLTHKLGRTLPRGSALVAQGRTGIVHALAHAAGLFASGQHRACVIAGVESFLRQPIADHYMLAENRLLTAANSNGFTLGEAAAAVLVTPAQRNQAAELIIAGTGHALDASGAGGNAQHPAKGEGLTQAIIQALHGAQISYANVDLLITDANGEHWKFKESTFAAGRLDRPRPDGQRPRRLGYLDHWHPIEFVGEIGAAIGPLALGWALHAGVKGYLDGPRVLLHMSEDNGERAAIVAEFTASNDGEPR